MIFTDTHAHLYLPEFDSDRNESVERAIGMGVKYMLLPNITSQTVAPMLALAEKFGKNIFPMIGLHPTDVKDEFEPELDRVKSYITHHTFYAIGETGIDLYWDKTHLPEQIIALTEQINWAKELGLPIVLHVRESFNEIFEVIGSQIDERLTGVFHCFSGTAAQARQIVEWGFKLGIGGVITYKNSGLDKSLQDIPLQNLVLETDAPFLTPVPFRGKRNESAYILNIASRLAEVKNTTIEEIAEITTQNAVELFKFPVEKS
jgi:TatD DNase family protein